MIHCGSQAALGCNGEGACAAASAVRGDLADCSEGASLCFADARPFSFHATFSSAAAAGHFDVSNS
jgi:hypothetical protein